MKDQKFYKLLLDGSKPPWEEVEGEMVDIGVLAFGLAEGQLWSVFDLRSGQAIYKQFHHEDKAIEMARDYIQRVGLAQYLDWQKQDIFEYGESPATERILGSI